MIISLILKGAFNKMKTLGFDIVSKMWAYFESYIMF